MRPDQINAIFRQLDTESDAQIAAKSFPAGGLHFQMSESLDSMIVGSARLPPGPPPALHRRDDGSYGVRNVAIVRVQPETALLAAQKMVRRSTLNSAFIGLAGGIVTLALMTGLTYWREQRIAPMDLSAPCLVAVISKDSVSCRVGTETFRISPGKFFPDGRFQLSAVNEAMNGFIATRITDRQTVVFQTETISPTNGANPK